MKPENENYKILAASAIGAFGGLVLGSFIWGGRQNHKSLSEHLANLSKIIEEIEGINAEEASDMKVRIKNILQTLESSYGTSKE